MSPSPRRLVVLCVALAVTGGSGLWLMRQRRDANLVAALVTAAGSSRPFEARLTGGFPHAPVSRLRSGESGDPGRALEIAALEAERAATASPTAANLAAAAKGRLLRGDHEGAIGVLQRAVRDMPTMALLWSDLSAAYLVSAAAGSPADTVKGLNAALTAVSHDPSLLEARFNAALALATNNLDPEAHAAWITYRDMDRESAWSREAAERLRTAPPETWAELRERIRTPDSAAGDVDRAVERFPHAVRELIEDALLPGWASTYAKDPVTACAHVEQAHRLARALEARGGDHYGVDLVRAISSGRCARPDRALVTGFAEYVRGRQLMITADFRSALPAFREASKHLDGSHTLEDWARIHLAFVRYQAGDLDGSLTDAQAVETRARSRSHHALLARALFVKALSLRDKGRPDSAMQLCSESIEHSERIRESFHARATARAAADIARSAGDDGESWRLMVRSLAAIEDEPSPVRRYLSYFNAALFARGSGLLNAALAFQNAAVRAGRQCAETGALAQALGQRAYLHFLLGRATDAEGDLRNAQSELRRVSASPVPYYEAELNTIEAALRMDADPRTAKRLLETASIVFLKSAPEQVPDTYVALGRASLRSGDRSGALRAFTSGIGFFEQRRGTIADEDARIAFFGTARDLYRELIALLLDTGDPLAAFSYADRIRARALLDLSRDTRPAGAGPSPDNIGAAIGADAVFVSYLISPGVLRVWTVDGKGRLSHDRHPFDAPASESHLDTLRSTTVSTDREREAAAALHELLVTPVLRRHPNAKVWYLAADGFLHGVPFAQLLNGATGRRLVEDITVVLSPSASWLVRERTTGMRRRDPTIDLLAIGNPALRSGRLALPPLPSAEAEVTRIAAMYRAPHVLRGASATRAAVLRRISESQVIHFGGHAVQNGVTPSLSHLMLAPDSERDDGRLRASDIAALRLDGTSLVVLGACSTARGVARFGEGPLTLARPFLAAGAASVVASLWDVEDRPTATLLTQLHQGLRQGLAPAEALRSAQLQMLRSHDPSDRLPRHWSAFAVFGSNLPLSRDRKMNTGATNE